MARPATAAEAQQTFARLRAHHPEARCELEHRDPFTLLVSVVLSAQTTDVAVNRVTPRLFATWPTAPQLAAAEVAAVELLLNRLGMYRQKARNIVALARELVTRHGGEVPRTLTELIALPGVGRKTANVVLGVAFGTPEGVVVDTHVLRLAQRLGWSRREDPAGVEQDLVALFPREQWDLLSHTIIFHGRRVCTARAPACAGCVVSDRCPAAFHAEAIGRKPPRRRTGRPAAGGDRQGTRAAGRR